MRCTPPLQEWWSWITYFGLNHALTFALWLFYVSVLPTSPSCKIIFLFIPDHLAESWALRDPASIPHWRSTPLVWLIPCLFWDNYWENRYLGGKLSFAFTRIRYFVLWREGKEVVNWPSHPTHRQTVFIWGSTEFLILLLSTLADEADQRKVI